MKHPWDGPAGLDAAQRLAVVPAEVPFVTVRRWRKGTEINAARPDLALDLLAGEVPRRLLVEVRGIGASRVLRGAIQELEASLSKRPPQYAVLAAPYVGARARAVCREAGVGHRGPAPTAPGARPSAPPAVPMSSH